MSVDLFGGKPLGIFTNTSDLQDSQDILSTWNYLQNRELKLAVTHPPKNYFEKMAIWTDQGKLWKFPIDNEQGKNVNSMFVYFGMKFHHFDCMYQEWMMKQRTILRNTFSWKNIWNRGVQRKVPLDISWN